MSTIPPFHSPNNLTADQYGASEGWRLLRQKEIVPIDAEYFDGRWQGSICVGELANGKFSYRTRTPDPFAAQDEWVKMSERKPVHTDMPVTVSDGFNIQSFNALVPAGTHWTHWRSIKLPARELTQAEKDDAAFLQWRADVKADAVSEVWHAALAYERARTAAK